jgi:2-dehydro-3-deoxyphosphogluconate aldolase / (4S)-4-hydroxy-2-oxoglutarate aldolase
MQHKLNAALRERLCGVPVVPVLTIDRLEIALPLARALVEGGLGILEITLRSPVALTAIHEVAARMPETIVAAGTVRSPEQAEDAIRAGANFLVSPGITPRLLAAAQSWSVPFLPAVATASEAMALCDLGYRVLKFFPAEPAGGVATVKALAGPLPDLAFCPTGGIDIAKASDYLAQPNVVCVGGSWVAPPQALAAGNWTAISALAHAAAALRT